MLRGNTVARGRRAEWRSFAARAAFACVALWTAGACHRTSAEPAPLGPRGGIAGRWTLDFDVPGAVYRTPVEIRGSGDSLAVSVLGPSYVRFQGGRVEGDHAVLRGRSAFGGVSVALDLRGDSVRGRWRVKRFFGGAVRGVRALPAAIAVPRAAILDSVWTTLRTSFYDPAMHGVDWDAAHDRYRAMAETASSDGVFVEIVRRMLGELRSSHLDFSALPTDSAILIAHPDADRAANAVVWRMLDRDVAYLRVGRFREDPTLVAQIDSAFSAIGSAPMLVLDLRGNPGGTLSAATRLGDHLFAEPRVMGAFATRTGLTRAGAASVTSLPLEGLPRYHGYDVDAFLDMLRRYGAVAIEAGGVGTAYRGRVALLIDEGCASTTEAVAAILKETHAAVLVGRKTAGAMLSSLETPIVGGWWLRYPQADFRTAGGARVEGVGVWPDVEVGRARFRDAQLRRAVAVLRSGGTR